MPAPTLVLIGPMAAGKSRTGKRLARALELPLWDTDKMITAEHGDIPGIFAAHGEAHFRQLERAAVVRALTAGGIVSLGGGAVLDADTQADLADCAVVYLSTTAEAVAARLAGDESRPLLASGGIERWTEIFQARRGIYERLGTLQIDTSNRPMDAVASEIADWFRAREHQA